MDCTPIYLSTCRREVSRYLPRKVVSHRYTAAINIPTDLFRPSDRPLPISRYPLPAPTPAGSVRPPPPGHEALDLVRRPVITSSASIPCSFVIMTTVLLIMIRSFLLTSCLDEHTIKEAYILSHIFVTFILILFLISTDLTRHSPFLFPPLPVLSFYLSI